MLSDVFSILDMTYHSRMLSIAICVPDNARHAVEVVGGDMELVSIMKRFVQPMNQRLSGVRAILKTQGPHKRKTPVAVAATGFDGERQG